MSKQTVPERNKRFNTHLILIKTTAAGLLGQGKLWLEKKVRVVPETKSIAIDVSSEDYEYIVNANPQYVLEMVSVIERQRKTIDDALMFIESAEKGRFMMNNPSNVDIRTARLILSAEVAHQNAMSIEEYARKE